MDLGLGFRVREEEWTKHLMSKGHNLNPVVNRSLGSAKVVQAGGLSSVIDLIGTIHDFNH